MVFSCDCEVAWVVTLCTLGVWAERSVRAISCNSVVQRVTTEDTHRPLCPHTVGTESYNWRHALTAVPTHRGYRVCTHSVWAQQSVRAFSCNSVPTVCGQSGRCVSSVATLCTHSVLAQQSVRSLSCNSLYPRCVGRVVGAYPKL